jgi:hypothetical protein
VKRLPARQAFSFSGFARCRIIAVAFAKEWQSALLCILQWLCGLQNA